MGGSTNAYWNDSSAAWWVTSHKNAITGAILGTEGGYAVRRIWEQADLLYPRYSSITIWTVSSYWHVSLTNGSSSVFNTSVPTEVIGQAQPINDGLAVRCVKN